MKILMMVNIMSKQLLTEFFELCKDGICQDLLTEDEKRFVSNGGMMLSGKLQEADFTTFVFYRGTWW